jgi:gag-polyprotein putative aspartyl protease
MTGHGPVSILSVSLRDRAGASIAMLAVLALLSPPGCARTETVLLPFRSVHSLILIDAKVNGNPATLVLDTGANNTIIDSRMYGNLRAPSVEPVSKGPGVIGNALRLRADLEISGRFLFSQPVSVMNLGDLPQRVGAQFDGLLGQDILRQFRSVRINYQAHVIELEK